MITLQLLLFVFSAVCLLLAAVNVPIPRLNLGWLGMFFWVVAIMLK